MKRPRWQETPAAIDEAAARSASAAGGARERADRGRQEKRPGREAREDHRDVIRQRDEGAAAVTYQRPDGARDDLVPESDREEPSVRGDVRRHEPGGEERESNRRREG